MSKLAMKNPCKPLKIVVIYKLSQHKQKKRGIFLKTFFGSVFIEKEKLEEAGITHPIKLEYYKQINEDEINSYEKPKYGIHIIKTEYEPNYTKVENKSIKYVTNDEIEANQILDIFRKNQVTPINSEEVIVDLFRKKF